jgi:outer membrane autotransporter protein
MGFAPEHQTGLPSDIARAYDGVLKAPPKATFDQRWSAWGSAFGGTNRANGDAIMGSTTVTAASYGFAAGMDYHLSPDSVLGFSLAGGGTSWGLAQGLGTGRSDALMAGIYGATHFGPAYVAGSLGFADHWFTTNRTGFAADQLTASFNGQSLGARIEGGYRIPVASGHTLVGVTPYAAAQSQWFRTPAYSETDLTAGGFGLAYGAMTANDTRGELGTRLDALTGLYGMPLVLRGRVAWAHDWVANPALAAAFQALPGATFIVNGAPMPRNSALTSASAELRLSPGWWMSARVDGEFASSAQTYAGIGTLRYSW